MSIEPIGVLIAVVAVGAILAGLILSGQRAIRAELEKHRRELVVQHRDIHRDISTLMFEVGSQSYLPRIVDTIDPAPTTDPGLTWPELEHYRLEVVLGSGLVGITYRAYDTRLEKVVVVKEYLPRRLATRTATGTVVFDDSSPHGEIDARGLPRFLEAERMLAQFDHPHVNKVYDCFEANGTGYAVLEYIEGETLAAVLWREEGRLDETRLRRLLNELLAGLQTVHAAQVYHLDIKPSNIMLRPDGGAVLLDFDTARSAVIQEYKKSDLTQDPYRMTPGYAPIEQHAGDNIGPWSDIYSLGMTAYQCVTGLPELPSAPLRSRWKRKGQPDMPPAVSVGEGHYDAVLLAAIDWAIQVDEEDRPQSVVAWQRRFTGTGEGHP